MNNINKVNELNSVVKSFPALPGVYLMKDVDNKVIYVGKAKSLKDRVLSYFGSSSGLQTKTIQMVSHIDKIEYILTDTENEALILENNLIKKYYPRYNIMLKDDKTYPYVKVTLNEDYPRLEVTRDKKDDGAKYFGPFPKASIIKPSIKYLAKLFPLRTCKGKISNKKLCLDYHIKKCSGPCDKRISREEYMEITQQVILFLDGKYDRLLDDLKNKMHQASNNTEYEKAALYRDRLFALQKITQKQRVVLEGTGNLDFCTYYSYLSKQYIRIASYRNGLFTKQKDYVISGLEFGLISDSVLAHYEHIDSSADYLITDISFSKEEEFNLAALKAFSKIIYPQRGQKVTVLKYIKDNLIKEVLLKHNKEQRFLSALSDLKKHLKLNEVPKVIVGFDISNLGGKNIVASAVVFTDGKPDKRKYRKFSMKTVKTQDDFLSMYETVGRYFKKNEAPDIILVDGGKGQLSMALEALHSHRVAYKTVLSLAKKNEEIFLPGAKEPLVLSRRSEGLKLLQRVRDEAHRFAVSYQRAKRAKQDMSSVLSSINGVSKERAKKMMLYFGSVNNISKASVTDIMNVPGIGKFLAENIYNEFH